MFYPKLVFPTKKDRPFFYTNFVQTMDGKVAVKREGYWPIGSKFDHKVLMELRAYADCLIHGGNLAREFGEITLKSIDKPSFKAKREKLGKNPNLPYYIVSKNIHFTHSMCQVTNDDPKTLAKDLYKKGYKHVLIEGGPTLLGSFLKENLIDEIFLTIAPKIYGSEKNVTKTLVEGILLPPQKIKKLELISLKQIGNELFLRYKLSNKG